MNIETPPAPHPKGDIKRRLPLNTHAHTQREREREIHTHTDMCGIREGECTLMFGCFTPLKRICCVRPLCRQSQGTLTEGEGSVRLTSTLR
jgi:hypothetical protein